MPGPVEINSADTNAFISLPGIGSKLANRIVLFREKLGGFVSVQQLADVYGLPDPTYQQLRVFLSCDSTAVKKLDINRLDAATLAQHPYIRWPIAKAIVRYREQHGPYKSTDQLRLLAGLPADWYPRALPYLKAE